MSLPCRYDGKLVFRKFGLLPLGEKLPPHPGSLVKTLDSKDLPAKKHLVALRLFVPKCFVSDDKCKSFKAQPRAGVDEWRGVPQVTGTSPMAGILATRACEHCATHSSKTWRRTGCFARTC